MMDAEGSERKNVSPLSGIRLSILSMCFFALGFLVRAIIRSKPLGVSALIVPLLFCRRFFGSDHL